MAIQLERAALDQAILTTGFSVPPDGISGNSIQFNFATMPGNRPSTYGNTAYLWQTSQQFVPPSPPQKSAAVTVDTSDGSGSFDGLDVTRNAYLLGYAVGGDVKNICATVFVPASGGGDPASAPPSVTLWIVGTTSVSFNYQMPEGTRPQTDGDWAGLWQGQSEAALYSTAPTWFTQIKQDDPNSNGSFNNVSVRRATMYTIGYFKGGFDAKTPKQTTLACSVTFRG